MRLTFPSISRTQSGAPAAAAPSATWMVEGNEEPLFSEDLLARLRRLTVLSRRTIAEGLAGEHRSRRRGSSPELADFKSYSQGDDFRRIDWNIYARLDEVFVRLSEVTTELTIHVLLDASNSMDWRSEEGMPTKFRYARQIAGSICYVSLWHFDRVMITPFGDSLGQPFGPSQGHAHVVPMLTYLARLPTLGTTNLPGVLDRYARARRRPGIMLLISDLLSGETPEIAEGLRVLRSRGWQTIVVHVLDAAEFNPALMTAGPLGAQTRISELLDVESGDRLQVTPTQRVLQRYQEAFDAWLAEVERFSSEEHVDYLRLQTDWPVDTLVLRLLHERGILA
jgi:uncharacterized protein (DUF58 family)